MQCQDLASKLGLKERLKAKSDTCGMSQSRSEIFGSKVSKDQALAVASGSHWMVLLQYALIVPHHYHLVQFGTSPAQNTWRPLTGPDDFGIAKNIGSSF